MTRNASSLAAIAGATVIAFSLSSCGKDNFSEKTLTYTESETNDFGFNDAAPNANLGRQGPDKLTPADGVTFASDLLDSSKKKVGELNAQCIFIRPGAFNTASAQCSGTATVPGGTLVLSVGGKLNKGVSGAITGGTGDYTAAGGTFTSSGGRNSTDTFEVQIPQK